MSATPPIRRKQIAAATTGYTARDRAEWAITVITQAQTWEDIEDHGSDVDFALKAFARTCKQKARRSGRQPSTPLRNQIERFECAIARRQALFDQYRAELGLHPRALSL